MSNTDQNLGTYKGEKIDGSMSKEKLLEVIAWLIREYSHYYKEYMNHREAIYDADIAKLAADPTR